METDGPLTDATAVRRVSYRPRRVAGPPMAQNGRVHRLFSVTTCSGMEKVGSYTMLKGVSILAFNDISSGITQSNCFERYFVNAHLRHRDVHTVMLGTGIYIL